MARVYQLSILLPLLLTACISPRLEQRDWIEVKSRNFSLFTDLGRADAVALSEDIELFRAVVMKLTNAKHFEPRVPTRIFAFSGPRSFLRFTGSSSVAGFFQQFARENLVALDASGTKGMDARLILFHEYTHFLVHNQNQLALPRWYDEGFAEFMGTVQLKGDQVVIGAAPVHRSHTAMHQVALDYDEILRAKSLDGFSGADRDMFYVQSWQIVHNLMLGPGRQLGNLGQRMARYIQAVERGEDEDRAFQAAFGISIQQLEDAVQAYHGARQIPATAPPRSAFQPDLGSEVRAVPAPEMAERLGWLALIRGNVELAQGYFERALAAEPRRPRAHAGLGDVYLRADRQAEAEFHYEQALAFDPYDPLNHLERAEALHYLAEEKGQLDLLPAARKHYARAIELAPELPEGHQMLARTYLLTREDPTPGMLAAERARDLLPGLASIQLSLAQLYAHSELRDDAIACARRALLLSEGESKEAKQLLADLGQPIEPPQAER